MGKVAGSNFKRGDSCAVTIAALTKMLLFRRIHPKIKILSSLLHAYVVLVLSSVENKRRCSAGCSCCSFQHKSYSDHRLPKNKTVRVVHMNCVLCFRSFEHQIWHQWRQKLYCDMPNLKIWKWMLNLRAGFLVNSERFWLLQKTIIHKSRWLLLWCFYGPSLSFLELIPIRFHCMEKSRTFCKISSFVFHGF